MRVLLIYAHPVETSFNAAVHDCAVRSLTAAGHEVDDCDLYAEGFDPVLSRRERLDYHDERVNRTHAAGYIERLTRAQGLMFVYPTWSMSPPAILKGFLDRVMVPGVAFDLTDDGKLTPRLTNIGRIGAAVTYGQKRLAAEWFGNPSRRLVTRYVKFFTGPGTRTTFLAFHNVNVPDEARRRRHLDRVAREMARF